MNIFMEFILILVVSFVGIAFIGSILAIVFYVGDVLTGKNFPTINIEWMQDDVVSCTILFGIIGFRVYKNDNVWNWYFNGNMLTGTQAKRINSAISHYSKMAEIHDRPECNVTRSW